MQNKRCPFAVSNPLKCIANLRTQPIHFKMNPEVYKTSFVMKEVVKKYFDLPQLYLDDLAFYQIYLFDLIEHH